MVVPLSSLPSPWAHTHFCVLTHSRGWGVLGYQEQPLEEWGTEENASVVFVPVGGKGWQTLRFL